MAGTVSAKTDRLEGIVDFTEQQVGMECFFWIDFDPPALSDKDIFIWPAVMSVQDPLENLNTWSYNTNKLMDLVMKTTHLINKEEMVRSQSSSNVFFLIELF